MKIMFISNYLTPHQLPFCIKMNELCSGEFRFVNMESMTEERKNMGWQLAQKYDFELDYSNFHNQGEIYNYIENADAVLYGGGNYAYLLDKRIKSNKLTFLISERVYRNGIWRVISPRGLYYMYINHTQYNKNNIMLLSAGSYTPYDYSLVNAYRGKAYKWGYFPKTDYRNINEMIKEKEQNNVVEILWVARLIELKHPELILKVAQDLVTQNSKFHLSMIGSGALESSINDFIKENGLEEYVTMCGVMSPEKVREKMRKSDVFVFTSDFREGWGAVINEAMNSGCAVVVSHCVGAAYYLIKNNQTGLIYRGDSYEDLYASVNRLVNDKDLRNRLGRNACAMIQTEWNAEVASERLYSFIDCYKNHKPFECDEGPMSKAEIISEKKMYAKSVIWYSVLNK